MKEIFLPFKFSFFILLNAINTIIFSVKRERIDLGTIKREVERKKCTSKLWGGFG